MMDPPELSICRAVPASIRAAGRLVSCDGSVVVPWTLGDSSNKELFRHSKNKRFTILLILKKNDRLI